MHLTCQIVLINLHPRLSFLLFSTLSTFFICNFQYHCVFSSKHWKRILNIIESNTDPHDTHRQTSEEWFFINSNILRTFTCPGFNHFSMSLSLNQHVMCYQMKSLTERLRVFHQFYYLYKQNRIAASSVSLFCLRSLSGWQIDNYTFFLFTLEQNRISYLHLGWPKCFECWNFTLKTKPNSSRISSDSSVKSLQWRLPGLLI